MPALIKLVPLLSPGISKLEIVSRPNKVHCLRPSCLGRSSCTRSINRLIVSLFGSQCCPQQTLRCKDTDITSNEFMHRAEMSFRALHERVLQLEERQITQGPSDEQVERILRKILAERFGHAPLPQNGDVRPQMPDYFVEPRGKYTIPQAIPIDPISLLVDPQAVPSTAYTETFQMLEQQLETFPRIKKSRSEDENEENARMGLHVKTPKSMDRP